MIQEEIEVENASDNCNQNVFNQLIKSMERLYSNKKVMELPLYFTLGRSFKDNYENFSSQYLKILRDTNVDVDTIEIVEQLTTELLETVKIYLSGKIASAYSKFEEALEPIKEILPIKTLQDGVFYRMRAGCGITDVSEFKHLPFNKLYLSKNERFSIEGYPCLYLGFSKRVCELEISSGSIAKFDLKDNVSLNKILDLTLGQGEKKKDISETNLIRVYPLIASCYIVPFYSTIQEKECRPDKSFFREEYIIPQLLTLYLKEKEIANGIIYYSVKDEKLDPRGEGEKDFRNLVLFTNREWQTDDIYDNALIDNFNISL